MDELDIFVSYAREDEARILPLVRALESRGWRVFWDRTIPIGETWLDYVGARLDAASVVVVAWSRDSVKSEFVYSEASHARQRRVLVPVLIDPVKPPLGLDAVQSADLVAWLGQGGNSALPRMLLDAITRRVPARPPPLPDTPPVPAETRAPQTSSPPPAPPVPERQAVEAPAPSVPEPALSVPTPAPPAAQPARVARVPWLRRRLMWGALALAVIAAIGVAIAVVPQGVPSSATVALDDVQVERAGTVENPTAVFWAKLNTSDLYDEDVRTVEFVVTFMDANGYALSDYSTNLSTALVSKGRRQSMRFRVTVQLAQRPVAVTAEVRVIVITGSRTLRTSHVSVPLPAR